MDKQERLVKNTIILFIGVIGTKLINFLMLPLFTSWLSVEEYGTIDIFTVIISMVVPVLSLQMDQGVFRFMIDDNTELEKKVTVSSGVYILCIVLLLSNIICFPILFFYNLNIYISYLFAIDLQCIFVMMQQIVRGMGKNKIYSINSIVLAFTNVLFSVLFIRFLKLGVSGYIYAFCISHIVAIIFMALSSRIRLLLSWSEKSLRKGKDILKYSVPMIVNNVSWWILNASDKLVLNLFCGLNANGIFAASGKIPGLITTIYSVFHLAWQESTSREKEDVVEFYSQVFRRIFVLISFSLIALLCFGPILFSLLINEKFAESYYHMPILLLALLFYCLAQFYGGIYVGYKKSKELGYTSAVAAIINLSVDFALVHFVRIYAASLSTLVAYFSLMVIRYYSIKKICILRYKVKENLIVSVIICISMIAAYIKYIPLLIGIFCIAVLLYCTVFKDVVYELIFMIKSRLLRGRSH